MEAPGTGKQLVRLARYATVWAAIFVLFAIIIWVYWFHVAQRPLAPIPKNVVASIEQTTDIERLRNIALILARGRDQLVNDIDETLSRAVVLIVTLSFLFALAFAICARATWRTIRAMKGNAMPNNALEADRET